jgi:hypothetical protein
MYLMNTGCGRVRYGSRRGALVLCCEKYNEFSVSIKNKTAHAGHFFFEDWLKAIHMVRHVSACRKHVALSCPTGGPLCSMVPRAKFFQHIVHKVSKVESEEAYISFLKKRPKPCISQTIITCLLTARRIRHWENTWYGINHRFSFTQLLFYKCQTTVYGKVPIKRNRSVM